jgi:hypothetical protein
MGGRAMLSVSSSKYFVPVRHKLPNGQMTWALVRHEANDMMIATSFNYTFKVLKTRQGDSDRATLVYDGTSVKPTPRTLRVYGTDWCQKIVSIMSTNTENHLTLASKLSPYMKDLMEIVNQK